MRTVVLLLTLLFCSTASYAQNGDSSVIVSVDAIDVETESDIQQQVNYRFPFASEATVHLKCFQYRNNDSICLYNLAFNNVKFQQGFNTLNLNLEKADSNFFLNKSFFKLLGEFKRIPPGLYKTYITINCKDNSRIFEKDLITKVDSVLAIKTRLRNRINKALAKTDPSRLGSVVRDHKGSGNKAATEAQVDITKVKIDRSLRKMRGVTTRPEMRNGKAFISMYYEDWFLGKYEVMAASALNQKIAAEYSTVKNNASSLVESELEDFTSISSQIKDLYTNKEDKNLTGNIDLTSVFATGQEQGSQQDNNYVEVRANASTEVFEIPINVEGYYTTQDNHRQAKASYFRLHYDVQTAKSKLSKIISGFKGKYNEAMSQQTSLQSIYGGYLNTLNSEKARLTSEFTHYGIDLSKPDSLRGNSDQLLSVLSNNIDTTTIIGKDSSLSVAEGRYQKLQHKKDSIAGVLKTKYERLQETGQKIEKYTKLLTQYKEKLTLDSGLVYSKVQELSQKKDVSYKEMAKAAAGLLPDGKGKNFINGLTHFDVGIINEYESDYTMSGQTLKGGSLGYDFGFAKAGLSAGKTEYISRDGNVDQYSSWLLRMDFKPVLKQKIGLIYYTYSPGKKVLEDDNFIKSDITAPSFVQPVHIFSLTHEGDIDKNISLKNEAAVSYKQTASAKAINGDNIAIKTTAEYRIPKIKATLQGEYEHVGKNFENSSLPYIKAAIERYTLATEADLFRSFLTVGVQYNFLKQEAFAATGYNTKWGFDIKTNSRRYPNVSVSYKPYTTFRTYDDTFNIQQRPLSGEVWTARGSYQIRRHLTSHRFVFIFNQNSTNSIDTQSYSSKMWQVGYIYVTKVNVISANAGLLQLPQSSGEGYSNTNSYFLNAAVNRRISERISLMLGQDVATSYYGLQRLSTTIGTGYSFDKIPVTLRLQVRYSNIKPTEQELRRNVWTGQIGANWRFKAKLFSKNHDQ